MASFVWGMGLGTYESIFGERSPSVLGFAGALILWGMGLRAAADRAFRR